MLDRKLCLYWGLSLNCYMLHCVTLQSKKKRKNTHKLYISTLLTLHTLHKCRHAEKYSLFSLWNKPTFHTKLNNAEQVVKRNTVVYVSHSTLQPFIWNMRLFHLTKTGLPHINVCRVRIPVHFSCTGVFNFPLWNAALARWRYYDCMRLCMHFFHWENY